MPRWLNWPTGVSPLRAASGVGRLARRGPAGGAGGLFLQIIGLGGGGGCGVDGDGRGRAGQKKAGRVHGTDFHNAAPIGSAAGLELCRGGPRGMGDRVPGCNACGVASREGDRCLVGHRTVEGEWGCAWPQMACFARRTKRPLPTHSGHPPRGTPVKAGQYARTQTRPCRRTKCPQGDNR